MERYEKPKKKSRILDDIDKEADETYVIDEDSDLPVHEPFTKEKKIRKGK